MRSGPESSHTFASRGSVLASIVRSALNAAEREGLSRDGLLACAGLDTRALDDPDARVPQPAYLRVWREIEARTTNPFFGLHFAASQVEASTFSVVGFAARSSATFGEALARVARYGRVLNDAEEITVVREESVVVVGQNPRGAELPWPRHKAEGAIANYVLRGRAWTGASFRPLSVSFQHARPRDVSEHRRVFDCPLHFGEARNELRFDPSVLELAMRDPSPDLVAYLTHQADRRLASLGDATLLEEVGRAVREALPGGTPTISTVARRLGMSARSLQRRLAEEDTSFATVVDGIRRDLATEMLTERHVSIEEVAFLVGFADARGFRRAVERWTGRSPRELRAGLAG